MERKTFNMEIIYVTDKYEIVKCTEKNIGENGRPIGRAHTWYDVCSIDANRDIVARFKTKFCAKRWVRREK